jgi:hypothetical protein
MTSDRKKPGVAFWATVALLVAPLFYVLSFGPACWLVARADLRTRQDLVNLPFRPVIWAYSRSSGTFEAAMRWYAMVGCGTDSDWGFVAVDWDGPVAGRYPEFEWGHEAR